jgi:hypothetical protein
MGILLHSWVFHSAIKRGGGNFQNVQWENHV